MLSWSSVKKTARASSSLEFGAGLMPLRCFSALDAELHGGGFDAPSAEEAPVAVGDYVD
jgi:hypothetical protein